MLGDIKRDYSNPNLEVSEISQIQNVRSTNGAGADGTNVLNSPKGALNLDSIQHDYLRGVTFGGKKAVAATELDVSSFVFSNSIENEDAHQQ